MRNCLEPSLRRYSKLRVWSKLRCACTFTICSFAFCRHKYRSSVRKNAELQTVKLWAYRSFEYSRSEASSMVEALITRRASSARSSLLKGSLRPFKSFATVERSARKLCYWCFAHTNCTEYIRTSTGEHRKQLLRGGRGSPPPYPIPSMHVSRPPGPAWICRICGIQTTPSKLGCHLP